MIDNADAARTEGVEASEGRRQVLHLVVLAVLVVLTLALVLDNRQEVTVGWVVGEADAPLALALVVTFVLGLAVGWLGVRRRRT